MEHAEGCAECTAELADLRLLLAELAELPEPELPESVGIRLDAAVARAWQEADAEAERKAASDAREAASTRRSGRRSWRRFAVPLGSLALILAVVAGVGALLHSSSPGSSSSASSGSGGVGIGSPAFGGKEPAPASSAVAAWVHSLLSPSAAANSRGVTPEAAGATSGGGSSNNGAKQPQASALAKPDALLCSSVPQIAGYTVLTISRREFDGVAATLVVYQSQSTKEPAPNTVYAVVYAGSACPSSTSPVLAQGTVPR
jgi:hypothetical protein